MSLASPGSTPPPRRKTRILPLTLTGMVAALLFGISSAGAAPLMNQMFDLGTAAVTNVLAGFSSLSWNSDTVTQETDNAANQSAQSDADADSALSVNGDLLADNVVAATQSAGAAATNQHITGSLDAALDADLWFDAGAFNAQDTEQSATGDGPQNQQAQNEANAATQLESQVNGAALNVVEAEQESDGAQANQVANPEANAAANGAVQVIGTSDNTGSVSQQASGGPVNQYITNVFNSNTFIDTLQQITSTNILTILQLCNGQCNQVANVIANAIAEGLQTVIGDASTTANLSQESSGDGPANQNIEAENSAGADVSASQVVTSVNEITVEQDGGEQGNQQADIAADSAANGEQLVIGSSTVIVDAQQSADGDGAANQNMDLANDSQADVEGSQEVVSFNMIDVSQQNDGGQGNQSAAIEADSAADATQVIDGTSLILLSAGQSAGSDDGVNQNIAADNASAADVAGGQAVVSFNVADLEQTNDGDQGNQNAILILASDATGAQDVAGTSVIVAAIDQEADGTNQNADVSNDSAADVAAGQAIVSGNTADVSQSADADQGSVSQNVELDATSNAAGTQAVDGTSLIVTGITQEADGDGLHNQDASVESDSAATVGALQGVLASNEITTSQEADVTRGAGAQSLMIEPTATAEANQNVTGLSANVTGVEQGADGDDAKQMADVQAGSSTDVAAQQQAAAVNTVDASQEQDIDQGAGAQWALIAPMAGVMATQNVAGASGNVTEIAQDDGSGEMVNQMAEADASSATEVEAGQTAAAVNDVTLTQRATADRGAVAQAGEVAPVATTSATQNVAGDAVNVTGISQEGSGGQGNQSALLGVDAATQVTADQNALTANAVDITQECDVTRGACAQYFYVVPTAGTTATQNVSGTAGNVTQVGQDGGGGTQGNQDADVENSAAADVTAGQNAQTVNTTTVHQACTATMNVCAQYVEVGTEADTQAEQNVTGTASNTTVIDQSGAGDQGNQSAEVTDAALTTMEVNQDAATVNDTTIQQTGSDNGSQTATAAGNANTISTVNITGTSSNTTAITQE